jgi:hypothetical protein
MQVINPASAIDVGCSIGDLVRGFQDRGVTAIGIDSAPAAKEFFMGSPDTFVLADALEIDARRSGAWAELVTCFEVLSVIPEEQIPKMLSQLREMSWKWVAVGVPIEHSSSVMSDFAFAGWRSWFNGLNDFRNALFPWREKPAVKAIYHSTRIFGIF